MCRKFEIILGVLVHALNCERALDSTPFWLRRERERERDKSLNVHLGDLIYASTLRFARQKYSHK